MEREVCPVGRTSRSLSIKVGFLSDNEREARGFILVIGISWCSCVVWCARCRWQLWDGRWVGRWVRYNKGRHVRRHGASECAFAAARHAICSRLYFKLRVEFSVNSYWTFGLAVWPRARGLLGAGPEAVGLVRSVSCVWSHRIPDPQAVGTNRGRQITCKKNTPLLIWPLRQWQRNSGAAGNGCSIIY